MTNEAQATDFIELPAAGSCAGLHPNKVKQLLRALPTQTLPFESISRRLYHKKLYSSM
jgi:hypothetical protein